MKKENGKSDFFLNQDGEVTNKEGDRLEIDPEAYYDIIDDSKKYKKQAIAGFAVAALGLITIIGSIFIKDKNE